MAWNTKMSTNPGLGLRWNNDSMICFTRIGIVQLMKIPNAWIIDFFKTTLRLEQYMVKLQIQYRVTLTKFRCGNHRLPIVTGRYLGIDRKDRICKKCLGNKLGDEFHYIFECSFFESERKTFLKTHYRERPNVLKMYQLFNSVNDAELINLVKFCKLIILHIC